MQRIKDDNFYDIRTIVEGKWLKDQHTNKPFSAKQVRLQFLKGNLENINPFRIKNMRYVTSGKKLKEFVRRYYGKSF